MILLTFSCKTSSQDGEIENNESGNTIDTIHKENKFNADTSDIAIYEKLIKYSNEIQLQSRSLPEIELEVARRFVGTPYVGHTLEKDSVENLVINLRELDCTTFMENVSAISLCIKKNTISFGDYCNMLVQLRYRNGKIDGYPSRLHYTTDWLLNNQEKGLLKIVSEDFGTAEFDSKVDFMSTHPASYKQLVNASFVEQIKHQEVRISSANLKFIPKGKINEFSTNIQDGDIIAISTTIPGLDFSHVAIALWKNNQLYFFHASSSEKAVVVSDKTLHDYLAGMKKSDGIVVGRLNQ